jgi:hypothetical protein
LLLARDGDAVSPLNGILRPQSSVGATALTPARIGEDIFYVQEKHRGIRLLSPNGDGRRYEAREISILARHLFPGTPIVSMAFAYDTDKRGYGIYEDGRAFSVTVDREQELFAFTPIATRGKFKTVSALSVGTAEHLYFQVEREIDGHTMKMIEVMTEEESIAPEDAVHMDAAITTAKIHPAASLTASAASGDVTVTASASIFTGDDVGKVLWIGGGRGFVTGFIGGTSLNVTLTRPITILAPESDLPATAVEGDWWLNPLVTTVSNIPFEGETVAVVGDGKQFEDQLVVDGSITLPHPAAIVHVGFRFSTRITTLPLVGTGRQPLEGTMLRISNATVRVGRAGAFTIGGYDVPYRTDEAWSEPTRLEQPPRTVPITNGWEPDGSITIESDNSLPLEILQLTVELDEGD